MKLIAFLLLIFNLTCTPALAVDATTSSDKQKDIINLVQQKVKEKLSLITSPSTKPKSFIGTITTIDSTKISIDYQNNSKTILIDDDTAYVDIKRNKSKFANFKVGQGIIAMGYLNENNQLNGKRIVAVDLKSLENKNEVVIGKVVDISKSSPIIVVIPIKNKNSQYQIKTDTKTEILDKSNTKIASKDIVLGQKIIAIIQPDVKIAKTFYASKIINLDFATSSPSATPTPKN